MQELPHISVRVVHAGARELAAQDCREGPQTLMALHPVPALLKLVMPQVLPRSLLLSARSPCAWLRAAQDETQQRVWVMFRAPPAGTGSGTHAQTSSSSL